MRSSLGRATKRCEQAVQPLKSPAPLKATVLNLQRMSTEDGPGIRTTVFLKGCSLACSWCHNPESISRQQQTVWNQERCIACRTCEGVCPVEGISSDEQGIHVDADLCIRCGTCAKECPGAAMELLGQRWDVDSLVSEVQKDRSYFENSQGGVTVSGGEPGMQAPFVAAFLGRCRQEGMHTVLDTCGLCSEQRLLDMAAQADLVLYDLKLMDPEAHAQHTGQSNERILHNLRALCRFLEERPEPGAVWIRTPLIPGVTATQDNLLRIGEFIRRELGAVVERWELCSFNNLCESQYLRLGRPWAFAGVPLLRRSELDQLEATAVRSGVRPELIQVSGASRMET